MDLDKLYLVQHRYGVIVLANFFHCPNYIKNDACLKSDQK